jgi:hypothetical protein
LLFGIKISLVHDDLTSRAARLARPAPLQPLGW